MHHADGYGVCVDHIVKVTHTSHRVIFFKGYVDPHITTPRLLSPNAWSQTSFDAVVNLQEGMLNQTFKTPPRAISSNACNAILKIPLSLMLSSS
jgi:hypothetical protein